MNSIMELKVLGNQPKRMRLFVCSYYWALQECTLTFS